MSEMTEAQVRMLKTLSNAAFGVPIGLSDLSNPEFVELLEKELVHTGWVDLGSIKAQITEAGRAALSNAKQKAGEPR